MATKTLLFILTVPSFVFAIGTSSGGGGEFEYLMRYAMGPISSPQGEQIRARIESEICSFGLEDFTNLIQQNSKPSNNVIKKMITAKENLEKLCIDKNFIALTAEEEIFMKKSGAKHLVNPYAWISLSTNMKTVLIRESFLLYKNTIKDLKGIYQSALKTSAKDFIRSPERTEQLRQDFCAKAQTGLRMIGTFEKLFQKFFKTRNETKWQSLQATLTPETLRRLDGRWASFCQQKSSFSLGIDLKPGNFKEEVTALNYPDGRIELNPFRWNAASPSLKAAIAAHELLSHPSVGIETTRHYPLSSCIANNQKVLELLEAVHLNFMDSGTNVELDLPNDFYEITSKEIVACKLQ